MRRALRIILGRPQIERAVDEELAFHVQMRVERLVAAGFSPDAARREALRQFGDPTPVRRDCVTLDEERLRLMQRATFFADFRQDLTYAVRALTRAPAFAAVVIASLAIGIGANSAIFTLVDAVLLRMLPVVDAARLFTIGDPARVSSHSQDTSPRADLFSVPLYHELRDSASFASGLAASGRASRLDIVIGRTGDAPEHPRARFVSDNYFRVLGVRPELGRLFQGTEDAVAGGAPIAVVSDGYWTRRFNRDSSVIGREILVNGTKLTIVGVTSPPFAGAIVGVSNDLWLPLGMQDRLQPHQPMLESRIDYWLLLIGRLAPGVTLTQARAGYTTLLRRRIAAQFPTADPVTAKQIASAPIVVEAGGRGFSRVRAVYRVPLETLMIGAALVLLIVCANVANLLLARAIARGREFGVRLALGAGRARLVRQLLAECLVLAGLGSAAGLALAWAGSRGLLALEADGAAVIPLDVRPDLRVLAFTATLAVAAIGVFGLWPAVRASRVDLAPALRARSSAGTLGGRGGRIPLGKMLIAGQVALSLVLLVGAGLLVRSLREVQNGDTGLDRDHLLIVDVDAVTRGDTGVLMRRAAADLSARLAAIPGAAAVTYSENGIFSGTESSSTMQPEGFVATAPSDTEANYDHAGPGYVHAVGARLLSGRDLLPTDDVHAPPVVLINATMAGFYFHTVNAVGKTIRFSPTVVARVVGVVADAKDHDLEAPPTRRFYAPFQQSTGGVASELHFEVRSSGDPNGLIPAVRSTIAGYDPLLPINGIGAVSSLMRDSVREERLLARIAAGFGLLALGLAAIGLYGVMTYAIARRTSEIGLRVALGAPRASLVRMVVTDALSVVGLGLVIGVPVAAAATRLLGSQLHGIGPSDPVSYAIALGVLVASAVAATLPPALRAARVAPLVALQSE